MKELNNKQDILTEERPLLELPAVIKMFLAIAFLCLGVSLLIFPYYIVLAAFFGIVIAIGILFNPFIGAVLFIAAAYLHPLQFMPELKILQHHHRSRICHFPGLGFPHTDIQGFQVYQKQTDTIFHHLCTHCHVIIGFEMGGELVLLS